MSCRILSSTGRAQWLVLAAVFLIGLMAAAQLSPPDNDTGLRQGGGAALASCAPAPFSSLGPERFQGPELGNAEAFQMGGFTLRPLAAFDVQARVMSRETYSLDASAVLSPLDLALGWDRMADPGIYGALGISQSGRWYHYRWDAGGPPIPLDEIVRSSANMHMIPANNHIRQQLLDIDAGQDIRLRGWLVEVEGSNGFRWRSSTTRSDTGNGSCEVILVCAVDPESSH